MRSCAPLALLAAACTAGVPVAAPEPPSTPEPPPAAPLPWPEEGAALRVLAAPVGGLPLTVFLDSGHGVGTNSGNTSCLCLDEQDHNLRVAAHLAAALEARGHRVLCSRTSAEGPSYDTRIQAARQVGADLILGLHSDARGGMQLRSLEDGRECPWNDDNPGFAVLWSDEGEEGPVAARHHLAQAVAARLAEAGFLPNDGDEYAGIYQGESGQPGVFLDRHEPRRRIKMLRRPPMPAIIVETHHAWDRREEPRWQEEVTLQAFDAALIAALADWERGR